jgi:competence ComEA-like helix-hairpin-helix protein
MLKSNSSVFNTYAPRFKQQRLIFFACFSLWCIFLLNCSKNASLSEFETQNPPEMSASAININTANAAELEKLPRVGKETARKIIEHREKYGAFRRPEHLILVRGMSDKKFREIRNLVKVE